MKNRLLVKGILAIALVFGMMVVGCDSGGGGPDGPIKITITGITDETGDVVVQFYELFSKNPVADGEGTVSGGSVTVPLYKYNGGKDEDLEEWEGGGDYKLMIRFEETDNWYVYRAGGTIDKDTYANAEELDAELPAQITLTRKNKNAQFAFEFFHKIIFED